MRKTSLKTVDQQLKDMLERIQNGTFELIPCASHFEIKDPIQFHKNMNKLRVLNGLPPVEIEQKVTVRIGLSKKTYARVSKLAKSGCEPQAARNITARSQNNERRGAFIEIIGPEL